MHAHSKSIAFRFVGVLAAASVLAAVAATPARAAHEDITLAPVPVAFDPASPLGVRLASAPAESRAAYAFAGGSREHRIALAFAARHRDGRLVLDLEPADLALRLDGTSVPERVGRFRLERAYFGERGIHVLLVLDRSLRMRGALDETAAAARRMVESLEGKDRVSVVAAGFNRRPAVLAWARAGDDLEGLPGRIGDAMEPMARPGVPAAEQTSVRVRDAIRHGAERLGETAPPLARRAMVVLSPLGDDASDASLRAATRAAARARARVVVRHPASKELDAEAAERLARETGGAVSALGAAGTPGAFRRRAAELTRPHWVLEARVSANHLPADGRWHTLDARIERAGRRSDRVRAAFETAIGGPVSRLARLFEVIVPVFAGLVVAAGLVVIGVHSRRSARREAPAPWPGLGREGVGEIPRRSARREAPAPWQE